MRQGSMVEVEAPVKVCGDVHGQYSDVLRLFDKGQFPPLANYLFLGDYVDRGPQSLEVVTLFLAYKCKFPNNFFMLRGNHECGAINRVYGFLDEIQRKYGPRNAMTLWTAFQVRWMGHSGDSDFCRSASPRCPTQLWSPARSSACTAAWVPEWKVSISCGNWPVRCSKCPIHHWNPTSYGRIQSTMLTDSWTTPGASDTFLANRLF